MNLFSLNNKFWFWFWKIFWVLFRTAPLITFWVVTLSIITRFTRMLAFMLPLKVILLVGTPGIPRYFRFFIEPDEKMQWVVYLVMGAVVCYFLTLLFEWLIGVLSRRAGGGIFDQANEMALVSDSSDAAGGFYSKFCSIFANGLFTLLVFLILYFIAPLLLAFLVVALLLQVFISFFGLLGSDDLDPGAFKKLILEKRKSYIGFLTAFNFFGGFFVILYPYLVGQDGNILLSIISFLLLRQVLGSLSSLVNTPVRLFADRHKVNAFIFREFQLDRKEKKTTQALFDAFAQQRRRSDLAEVLSMSVPGQKLQQVVWRDSTLPGVTQLIVKMESEGAPVFYLENVFTAKNKHNLDNEIYLFEQLPRKRLHAPELIARYPVSHFECQLVDYGSGLEVGRSFNQVQVQLMSHLWSLHLPVTLVEAYRASHKLLHERLTAKYLERLEVALDSEEEEQVYTDFVAQLPEIQVRVARLPVVLINPDLNGQNLVWKAGDGERQGLGDFLVTSWARWKLEPLGVGMVKLSAEEANEVLVSVARSFSLDAEQLQGPVELVLLLVQLETAVSKMKFKAALGLMSTLLDTLERLESSDDTKLEIPLAPAG